MDNEFFNDLLTSVQDMGKHAAGKTVEGAKITEIPDVDI